MKIFAVIVTYNGLKWLDKCLTSLTQSSIKVEIIVIDNCSSDGSQEFIKTKFPQVDFIQATENLGFGKANNIGIQKAYLQNADYVFLLNQDAWVEKNTLHALIEAHQAHPEFGILSPVHLNGTGDKIDAGFFQYAANANENIWQDNYFNRTKKLYECRFVNAAAWLLSAECIKKVGGFNPLFKHYGEDDNYCQRVQYHQFKIGIVTTTFAYHDREDRKTTNAFFENQSVYFDSLLFLKSVLNINSKDYKNIYKDFLRKDMASIIFGFLSLRRALVLQGWKRFSDKKRQKKNIEQNRVLQEQQCAAFLSN